MATVTKKTFYTKWDENKKVRAYCDCEITETPSKYTVVATDVGIEIKNADSVTFLTSTNDGAPIHVDMYPIYTSGSGTYGEMLDYTKATQITFKVGKTSLVGKDSTGQTYPFTIGDFTKQELPIAKDPLVEAYLRFGAASSKKGTTTTKMKAPQGVSSTVGIVVPAIGVPLLSLSVSRSGDNATVVGEVESFEGDYISSSTITIGTITNSFGTGTVGADGKLRLTANFYNVSPYAQEVSATVTGKGGTSAVATATLGIKYNTLDFGASGKSIGIGGNARESNVHSNGSLDVNMFTEFTGGVEFDSKVDFNSSVIFGSGSSVSFSGRTELGSQTVFPSNMFEITTETDGRTFNTQSKTTISTQSFSISLGGYTPLGVVGWRVRGTTNPMNCNLFVCYLSGNTINYRFKNMGESALSGVYVEVNILWIRN